MGQKVLGELTFRFIFKNLERLWALDYSSDWCCENILMTYLVS